MNRKTTIICAAAALLILAVAGCAGGAIEQKDSALASELHENASSMVLKGWRHYVNTARPEYFALARDGSAVGYTWCPHPTQCPQRGGVRHDALTMCQAEARTPCDIYAEGRRIVWPHAFPWIVDPPVLYDYHQSIELDVWPK